jgi:hypothetical protein
MTGDYQAQLVQVQDIIQNGQCTGPVAEPVVWVTPHRVAVVFVCRQCAARHTLEGLPSSVVHLIQRAEDGRRMNANPTAQLRAAALLDTAPHGPDDSPSRWLHQTITGHGTEPASPELLDAAAEITGRRIIGVPLTGGGRAQVNVVAMVRSRLKRWAIQQERIHE